MNLGKLHLAQINVVQGPVGLADRLDHVVEHAEGERGSSPVVLDDLVGVPKGVANLLHPLNVLLVAPFLDCLVPGLPDGLAVLLEADVGNRQLLVNLGEDIDGFAPKVRSEFA